MTFAEIKLFETTIRNLDIAHRLIVQWSEIQPLIPAIEMKCSEIRLCGNDLKKDSKFEQAVFRTTEAYAEIIRPLRVKERTDSLFVDTYGVPITKESHRKALLTAWSRKRSQACLRPRVRENPLPDELSAMIILYLDEQLQNLIDWTRYAPLEDILLASIQHFSYSIRMDTYRILMDASGGQITIPKALAEHSRSEWHKRAKAMFGQLEQPDTTEAMMFFSETGRGIDQDEFFNACYQAIINKTKIRGDVSRLKKN